MKRVTEKKNIVGLKELRNNLSRYIARVNKGESFTVVRRSEPIFKVIPPQEDEGPWETVIDFTEINKNGISAEDVLKAIKNLTATT